MDIFPLTLVCEDYDDARGSLWNLRVGNEPVLREPVLLERMYVDDDAAREALPLVLQAVTTQGAA